VPIIELFKVGHEPIAPAPTKTMFGYEVYRLPNFIQYGKFLLFVFCKDIAKFANLIIFFRVI